MSGGEKEAQHHVLRTTFPAIRDSVKTLIEVRMDALDRKFHKNPWFVELDALAGQGGRSLLLF